MLFSNYLFTIIYVFIYVYLSISAPPREPRIENNGSQVVPNHNVTVRSDDKVVLKCVSRYGNPPAKLKWFLGKIDLGI